MAKRVTNDELKQNHGQAGRPAHVAYRGRVYDVSASKLWVGGLHQRRHQAGADLTTEFAAAPHDESVLARVPEVGELETREGQALPPLLGFLLDLHPHPIAIHFPIALIVVAAAFLVFYLILDLTGLATAAYYVLLAGVITAPVAIATGGLSWWFNYGCRQTGVFRAKIRLALVLFPLSLATIILWSLNREALADREPAGWVYFALLLVMSGLVLALG